MPNQKISELTTIVTVDNAVDLFPIVDTSANTTKKITPTALKSALALDNVNNTSDANKPVSTAQQDALNAKVTANAAIVAATKTKITYDAKGLVTAGDILDAADMPTGINAANIGTGVVSTTEFEYLNGVTSAIQTQIDAKQATLVSGTNIKTINGATVLGAGDITIAGNPPSGVAGAIQFSAGSAFNSDAANLFWNDTNNRLGIGTNAPAYGVDVQSTVASSIRVRSTTAGSYIDYSNSFGSTHSFGTFGNAFVTVLGGTITSLFANDGTNTFGNSTTSLGARLGIKGSGSTSATTSLLVQNSAGTTNLRVSDNGNVSMGDPTVSGGVGTFEFYQFWRFLSAGASIVGCYKSQQGFSVDGSRMCINVVSGSHANSASFQVDSTTTGILPPRMSTAQKNAIASPNAGLIVYDATTNKLCCYNGSTWNDLF